MEKIKRSLGEVELYQCSVCDYVSDNAELTDAHEGVEHTGVVSKRVAGKDLYYFEREEGLEQYAYDVARKRHLERASKSWECIDYYTPPTPAIIGVNLFDTTHPDSGLGGTEDGEVEWDGEGWYMLVNERRSTCCSSHWNLKVNAIPLKKVINEWEERIAKELEKVAELRGLAFVS
jgi:hypothetical protein